MTKAQIEILNAICRDVSRPFNHYTERFLSDMKGRRHTYELSESQDAYLMLLLRKYRSQLPELWEKYNTEKQP